MAMEYTEEQLNNFDKATLVQLFWQIFRETGSLALKQIQAIYREDNKLADKSVTLTGKTHDL